MSELVWGRQGVLPVMQHFVERGLGCHISVDIDRLGCQFLAFENRLLGLRQQIEYSKGTEEGGSAKRV